MKIGNIFPFFSQNAFHDVIEKSEAENDRFWTLSADSDMKHTQSSRRFFLCLLPWISVFFIGGQFLAAQTPAACQQTKVLLSDGQGDDLAGIAVDLNNDFLFVGKSTLFDPLGSSSTAGVYILSARPDHQHMV